MAVIVSDEDKKKKEEEEKILSTGPGAGAPSTGVTGDVLPGGGAGGAVSGTSTTAAQRATDLNAEQSRKMAEGLGTFIKERTSGKYGEKRTEVMDPFLENVKKGTTFLDDKNKALVDRAAAGAGDFVNFQPDVDKFTGLRDATYTGPMDLADADKASLRGSSAEQARYAEQLGTGYGIEQLLNDYMMATYGSSPTRSELSFNRQLLGAKDAAESLGATRAERKTALPGELNATFQAAVDAVASGQQSSEDVARYVSDTFLGGEGAYATTKKTIEDEVLKQREGSGAAFDAAREAAKSGQYDQFLDDLGLTTEQLRDIRNLQATGQALTPEVATLQQTLRMNRPDEAFQARNVATDKQYADWLAMNKLMNRQDDFLKEGERGLAGKANLFADVNAPAAVSRLQGQITGAQGVRSGQGAEMSGLGQLTAPGVSKLQASPQIAALQSARDKLMQDYAVAAQADPFNFDPTPFVQQYASINQQLNDAIYRAQALQTYVPPPPPPPSSGGGCFTAGTPIKMADGSFKPVESLKLGDETSGGKVLGHGATYNTDMYEIREDYVAGSHAVLHNGKWIRVCDHPEASMTEHEDYIVYPVIVEHHVMRTRSGLIFSDFVETDHQWIKETADELSLVMLNHDKLKIDALEHLQAEEELA